MTSDDEREAWLRALGAGDAVSRNALESIRSREAGERRKVTEAVAAAVAKERAAVVAWLREVAETMNHNGDRCCGQVEDLASAVERGEHRREEE